ncbi:PP2C family protein-serine/threonine phosphatase [Streptacidiphilus sp. P02-A3a]|uniref:PP2C family protein-serine/threonine phosphatase n=1 Tax=Streptacidiphilus sp. P02-A3a TaxID=2704468 RepID=UPI0015FE517A|nr:SpoIIE family protein phosphatase [Streptacidiphilus sp. P02-A3a]QMU73125.1 SpoIIE family protein phosphatase [Streptacidiphilus sp. P02-A3a]
MPAIESAHEPHPSAPTGTPIPRPRLAPVPAVLTGEPALAVQAVRPVPAAPAESTASASGPVFGVDSVFVGAPAAPLSVLVIDDDPEDAESVRNLLAEVASDVRVRWARNLDQASAMLTVDTACILLDLELPDGGGLEGLRRLLRRAPRTAVLAVTGTADVYLGAAAVAAGAQDFLVKQEMDGRLLSRAVRYAVERKRADESQRRLVEAELRGQENARLQRHLLPTPLLEGSGFTFHARYRPGRRRALLGGDFYDAVRTSDGSVHVVIGDVCGHGPDEAALGVALRIAWRTLVFAGLTGEALLGTLQRVLEHERRSEEIFATLCMLAIDPDGEYAELHLAGHPAPLLLREFRPPELLPYDNGGPALGLLPLDGPAEVEQWPPTKVRLGEEWSLMLYTDGLIEGRIGAGTRRLGQEGLIGMIADHQQSGLRDELLIDTAMSEVEDLNGGALADDVAVLLLSRPPAVVHG